MLQDLVVEGLGVIEHADVTFEPGSTALTGETGAGKTLLVAALGLLAGGRSERALVRSGNREARVEGRWLLPSEHPAVAVVRDAGFADAEDGPVEIVVSRSVGADGKGGRARINGRVAPVAALAETGRLLVEISGQHEHQEITRPPRQRALLDAFAGPEALELAARVALE
ncbi:MAG: AAA family ATPase, partial [Actinomycetota bacterium]|nr:AAA family ATPase [Actinomycetota bacterium]